MKFKTFIIVFLFVFSFLQTNAQDILVLKSGKRIAVSKLDVVEDIVRIVTYEEGVNLSFRPDAVLGYFTPNVGNSFYMKSNVEINGQKSPQFLERIEVGRINLYKKMSWSNTLYYYLEKDDRFEKVFASIENGSRKQDNFEIFSSFMVDDDSMKLINNSSFNFKTKGIIEAVQDYNRRNFVEKERKSEDFAANIILYRTKFQRIKRILKVELFGETCDLGINDYITFKVPLGYASKLTISGEFVKTDRLISGGFIDQYYEIVYNKKSQSFFLDKKEGSELQFEFYKIKRSIKSK